MDIVLPDLELYVNAVANKLLWLLIFAVADMLFGVIQSLLKKEFDWEYLTNYLVSNGIPIIAWLVAEFLMLAPQSVIPENAQPLLDGLSWTIYGTVALKIIASILGHFAALPALSGALGKLAIRPKSNGNKG